jgi:hypothetical protein
MSGPDSSGSVQEQAASSCEQGTEPSGFIKRGEPAIFQEVELIKIDHQYVVTYIKITLL